MSDTTVTYEIDPKPYVDGTRERPSSPRHAWKTTQTESVNSSYESDKENDPDDGAELFLLTQEVAGSFERVDGLEEYQTVYVPRPRNYPPIQKVTLQYLDHTGSFRNAIKRDRDETR
jgi:hypothetical protein